jgi:predicted RNA-binding Zn-ribbon protein involved in translation (DUF1610 family)
MEKYIRKMPAHGFISVCMKCKSNQVKIEVRADGVDFQCQKCGNKMLLRPGESFQIQVPEKKINKEVKKFEKELDKPLTDEWADEVLDDWVKKNGNT